MPPSFPTSILRIASISLRRRVDLQVPLGQQEQKTSAIRIPKSQMMFRSFSETWQLWFVLWINCGNSENKRTWVWCTWIYQFGEQRLETHVCFSTQNDPNKSSSRCCFSSMIWNESAEWFWHDSFRARGIGDNLFERKPLERCKCDSVIRFGCEHSQLFQHGDPWPHPKMHFLQESMTFGLWGSLLEGCKHVRFCVSIIL